MNTYERYIKSGGKLTEFPGSEGDIIISHDSEVHESMRGKGLGQKLHRQRIRLASDLNKSLMICTVNAQNKTQIHILEKFGWKMIHTFISECSCNRINVYVRSPWDGTGMKED